MALSDQRNDSPDRKGNSPRLVDADWVVAPRAAFAVRGLHHPSILAQRPLTMDLLFALAAELGENAPITRESIYAAGAFLRGDASPTAEGLSVPPGWMTRETYATQVAHPLVAGPVGALLDGLYHLGYSTFEGPPATAGTVRPPSPEAHREAITIFREMVLALRLGRRAIAVYPGEEARSTVIAGTPPTLVVPLRLLEQEQGPRLRFYLARALEWTRRRMIVPSSLDAVGLGTLLATLADSLAVAQEAPALPSLIDRGVRERAQAFLANLRHEQRYSDLSRLSRIVDNAIATHGGEATSGRAFLQAAELTAARIGMLTCGSPAEALRCLVEENGGAPRDFVGLADDEALMDALNQHASARDALAYLLSAQYAMAAETVSEAAWAEIYEDVAARERVDLPVASDALEVQVAEREAPSTRQQRALQPLPEPDSSDDAIPVVHDVDALSAEPDDDALPAVQDDDALPGTAELDARDTAAGVDEVTAAVVDLDAELWLGTAPTPDQPFEYVSSDSLVAGAYDDEAVDEPLLAGVPDFGEEFPSEVSADLPVAVVDGAPPSVAGAEGLPGFDPKESYPALPVPDYAASRDDSTDNAGWVHDEEAVRAASEALSEVAPQREDETSQTPEGAGIVAAGFTPFSRELSPGEVLGDEFCVAEVIGKGGFARVYAGFRLSDDCPVVIKAPLERVAEDQVAMRRFVREVRAAMSLEHANIVRTLGYGRHDNGTPYIVMERLEGMPLSQVIRTRRLELRDVYEIVRQILEALRYAHSKGLVHRDMKPSNVFVIERGGDPVPPYMVKVIDFGLVKRLRARSKKRWRELTRAGQLVGTPGYIAPEMMLGADVTPAVDVYSVGVVGFELLTGRPAFEGTPQEKAVRQRSGELPAIPEGLEDEPLLRVVVKMMAADPARRYRRCEPAIKALDHAWKRRT